REDASHIACKLFDALSQPCQVGALRLTVRASIGIALAPGDGTTADALLARADAAMYRAKRERLGYAFFAPGLDAGSTLDAVVERGAIECRDAFRSGAEGRMRQ